MVRITHISDTHSLHEHLAPRLHGGDILLHTGDISNIGEKDEVEAFVDWLSRQPYDHKVFIAGNHDLCFQSERMLMVKWDWHRNSVMYDKSAYNDLPDDPPSWTKALISALPPGVTYLQETGTEACGLKIWGSPASPAFGRMWAFNHTPLTIAAVWEKIPGDTDILMTHTPPFGYGDMTWRGQRAGCELLTHKLREIAPALHLCGHIHEGHGFRLMGEERETATLNSALQGYDQDMPPQHVTMSEEGGINRVSLSST